jgi:hypothetical protein
MKPAAVLLAAVSLFSSAALAQDYDDLDNNDSSSRDRRAPEIDRDVREITKGTYAKANVGGAFYLGSFSQFVRAGTALGLAVGRDFVNQERTSMAWELMFAQGIHNGTHYDTQAAEGCVQTQNCIQGDLRTYTFAGTVEWATYPNRRFGIGVRGGAGLLLSPLLMEETYYQQEVVQGSWGLAEDFGFHDTPHPIVLGGPTFEYYTKLAHFSVGADADVFYAIGFDLGASVSGNLKYTF